MKRYLSRLTVIGLGVVFVTASFCYPAQANEEHISLTAEGNNVVLPDIKPTLIKPTLDDIAAFVTKGTTIKLHHQNKAFVKMDTVKVQPDKTGKEMLVFWINDEPGFELAAAKGGYFSGGGVKRAEDGTWICKPNTYLTIDGNSEFTGNVDYDGSVYTFIGEVLLLGHHFKSDVKDPLTFKLVKDKGFVHVSGKGTVMTKEGREIRIVGASQGSHLNRLPEQ